MGPFLPGGWLDQGKQVTVCIREGRAEVSLPMIVELALGRPWRAQLEPLPPLRPSLLSSQHLGLLGEAFSESLC